MKKYVFALSLIAFLAYLNSFGNSFVWDDLNNIIRNDALDGPLGLKEVFLNPAAQTFYRPIPYLTLFLDQRLFKENPIGYHFTNFAFHLACVILIFFLCLRLTQLPVVSFISALMFAVHPVHTEAVAYISGRSDLICAFFIFLSFYLYLHFLDSIDPVRNYGTTYKKKEVSNRAGRRKLLYLCTALFSYLAALFSKEIALIFPVIILFYGIYPVRKVFSNGIYFYKNSASGFGSKRFLVISNIMFVGLAIFYLSFRYLFVKLPPMRLSLGKGYLLPKIFLFYLRLLIFPFNLHMQHSLNEEDFLLQMPLFLSTLIFLGVIFVLVKFIKDKHLHFCLVWFVFWLFPFLGIFKFNSGLAEHWLYISSFGFFLIAGKLIAQNNILKNKFVFSSIILFFCFLSIQRNALWRDDISIYQDTLKYRPNDPKLHYNLGNAYLRKGLLNAAAKEYSITIEGNPSYAYALNNLGLVFEKQGDTKAAHQHYEMAIVSDPKLDAAKKNLLRFGFTPLETKGQSEKRKRSLTGFTSLAFAQDSPRPFAKGRGSYFDHSLYGKVLKKFVSDGKVDYVSLKNNSFLLDKYLKAVAELDNDALNSTPRNEKIAFYLNVYNTLTLKVIVDYYPVKSIKDIPGAWDKIKFNVAGRELTLNQIEHQILRRKFKEPRIHFALVCASKGCPKLAEEPFSSESLDKQLDREAHKFINDKTKVRLDRSDRTLYISSIFKWFNEDFGDIIKFISKYLPEDEAEFIAKRKPKIKYLNYDWSLNEKS